MTLESIKFWYSVLALSAIDMVEDLVQKAAAEGRQAIILCLKASSQVAGWPRARWSTKERDKDDAAGAVAGTLDANC